MNRSRGIGSRNRSFFGRLSSVLGILLALAGAFFVNNVLTLTLLGIVLGALGTVLGTRRLGSAAVVVSVVVLLFGLAVFSGLALAWRRQATTIRSQKSKNDARFRT